MFEEENYYYHKVVVLFFQGFFWVPTSKAAYFFRTLEKTGRLGTGIGVCMLIPLEVSRKMAAKKKDPRQNFMKLYYVKREHTYK